jgi:tRNA-dihydrouridine synthase B
MAMTWVLEPIRLSNGVTIDWPVALAPMAGVTDTVFRGLCRDQGCGYATTEFARDRALLLDIPEQVALINTRMDARPVGVQIFGADPDEMRRAAALVIERSAPDVLDINMGCPAPKVTNGQGGSSLLNDPALASAIVAAVAKEIAPVPVTVKIRVGWDEAHKASGVATDVACRVVEAGAQMVTVHGRTRAQKYDGLACWDTISAVAASVPVPVIGNGDITTPEEAAHRLRTSGCRGIAIGRGARGRPWLFGQIRAYLQEDPVPGEPTTEQRIAHGLEHIRRQRTLERVLVGEDPRHARKAAAELERIADLRTLGRMLPHVMWYVWGAPGASMARRALSLARCGSELEEILTDFGQRPGRYEEPRERSLQSDGDLAVAQDTCPS